MADGFVKEPAVVTRKTLALLAYPEELERLKLEDGVRLHEGLKSSWRLMPARVITSL